MKGIKNIKPIYGLIAISVLTIIPFLGITDFYTKGEPREAIVALTMIESGNWILPTIGGIDLAYKPPLFHWSIALLSQIFGDISEFASRLPSALSFVALVLITFLHYCKNNVKVALGAALVLLSFFETHRAAFACRVDMMLTIYICSSLFFFYRWVIYDNMKRIPCLAILSVSFGVLTKGPVAFVLPYSIIFIFAIIIRKRDWKNIVFKLIVSSLLSLIIPTVWYYEAWQQGGNHFLKLIYEENVGRMTSTMSYQSHPGAWYMNVLYLLGGMMPYSLLIVILFPVVSLIEVRKKRSFDVKRYFHLIYNEPIELFNIISLSVIFLFYCIPNSKRSVYLLPMYPFLSYYTYKMIDYCYCKYEKIYDCWTKIILSAIFILILIFVIIRFFSVESFFSGGELFGYVSAIHNSNIMLWQYVIILLPILYLVYMKKTGRENTQVGIIKLILLLYLCLDGVIQPIVLNTKSDKKECQNITQITKGNTIYTYCSANMMRFFAINYYSHNKLQPILISQEELKSSYFGQIKTEVENGFLLIPDRDVSDFIKISGGQYQLTPLYSSMKKGCDVRDYFKLYKFIKSKE